MASLKTQGSQSLAQLVGTIGAQYTEGQNPEFSPLFPDVIVFPSKRKGDVPPTPPAEMKLNAKTAILSPKVLLVPYEPHHVPTYHAWMEDEELREATASERLTLEEEYDMQQKWRLDVDKLTFIICLSPQRVIPSDGCVLPSQDDTTDRMLGDVNLFLYDDESEESEKGHCRMVGEIEIMIAKKEQQGKGFGRAAIALFLHYVLKNRREMMKERFKSASTPSGDPLPILSTFRAKINQTNTPSINLFESFGFIKQSDQPNYFGEFELVLQVVDLEKVGTLVKCCGLDGWREVEYENDPYTALRRICGWF